MKKFEIRKSYFSHSIYDHNTIWKFDVIKRTESSITIQDTLTGETMTRRIDKKGAEVFGCELVYPFGKNGGTTLMAECCCTIGQ